ncbi:hypothetical protein IM792_06425 [Mucilaginibacter sp. JRF]|uniref:hypothetical protein n=1 Tax=Mucilaginibacter sp. JRF TaxID=2780088 RepID=UPI0018822E69|nr:hypothetical protein [Mucilaginibacter sp. JRF]MBE9584075.1 hypothetical protein [Mucilaginibacter sp. JRF]
MKKTIIYILSLFFCFLSLNGFSQNQLNDTDTPEFKNQGEQEDYWAQKFFQKEYKELKYKAFAGNITHIDNVFIFGRDSIIVSDSDEKMNLIFSKGLLYPEIIFGYHVSDIEELDFIKTSPKKRRFRFLLYTKGMHNPTVCFFELSNPKANGNMDMRDFIQNSTLTFFKRGWIMM